ncbi:cytochrome P450 [Streptomyces sp. NPDC093544]|uniref:cytochrome P450 n=1 Tax=Streptomyces sp. NPDC093544 TaxID=3155200 RepID=UPI0034408226
MNNPLPFYAHLREHHPVYYIEQYDTYFLSRFQDAWDFLSISDNTFVGAEGTLPPPEVLRRISRGDIPDVPLDPLGPHGFQPSPYYEILRQGHGKPLRPGAVGRLADYVREVTRERLDLLVPRGTFDLTQHFGGIVSASVMCHMFRLPVSEAKYVLDTVNSVSMTDPEKGGSDIALLFQRLREIVEPVVRARRKEGPDGGFPLVDGMFDVNLPGRGPLTDREIADTIAVVLLGGTETVPKVVAHGLWELSKDPAQWDAVRSDPAQHAGAAFEEMVRYCGPAQWFLRTVRRPAVVAGQEMRPGQRVAYLLPSAARDEREYGDDADSFRWNREISRTINFGHGQHFCIGIHLARLEGRILVEEFVKRVDHFEVDTARAVRRPSNFQWGWNELPIHVP